MEDLDGNGSKEFAALVSNGDLYTWDGPTRQLRNLRQGTDGTLLSNRATPAGLVLGDTLGVGHFLQWANNAYTETFTRQLATDCDPFAFSPCINGLNVTSDNSLWTGTGSILNQRLTPSYDNIAWESPQIGDSFGRFVATDVRNGENRVFSSAQHAVVGLGVRRSSAHSNPNSESDTDPNSDANSNTYAYPDSDTYSYTDPNGNAESYSNAHSNSKPDTNADPSNSLTLRLQPR